MSKQGKGLFYCQYLVGLGHLVRSLNLCRSLIKEFNIDFLLGGHDVNLTIDSPNFHLIPLKPLGVNPDQKLDIESSECQHILANRKIAIDKLQGHYDFLIIEFFPFSKWELKTEIEYLIKKAKTLNPKCLIICSLRDSFPPSASDLEEKIITFVNTHIDYIFVHSDPKIYRLQESFSCADTIAKKVFYTGFITNPDLPAVAKRKKKITVSNGAGSFGEDLMYAVADAAHCFPDYQFEFILGPKTPKHLPQDLSEIATETHVPNISCHPFLEDFTSHIAESSLSISLGGYTIIDTIHTHTRALVYPTVFLDQYIRTLKFSGFGLIQALTHEDLTKNKMQQAIQNALSMTISNVKINTDGSQSSCQRIRELLQ